MDAKDKNKFVVAMGCMLAMVVAVGSAAAAGNNISNISNVGSKRDSSRSMRGCHMVVAAESWPPWLSIDEDADGNLVFSGIMWNVLLFLQESIGFEFSVVRPDDGKWGNELADGSWTGMIGMVHRNEADFALGPFAVVYEREQVVDFAHPVVIDYWTVIVPMEDFVPDYWPIVRPFEWRVWLAIFVIIPFFIAVTAIADYIFDGRRRLEAVADFALKTVFLEQPVPWNRDDHSRYFNRMFACAFLLPIFVLGQAYCGILISILTVPNIPTPINSIEELVRQDEIGWAYEDGSIIEHYGERADPDSTWGRLYTGTRVPGTCYNVRQEIKEGLYGQICERVTIAKVMSDDFTETATCNYYVGTEDFLVTAFAMAFQTASPYLEEANNWLLLLLQMGLHEKWLAELMPNATYCSSLDKIMASRAKKDPALTFLNTVGLFSILLICLLAAIVAFAMETISTKAKVNNAAGHSRGGWAANQ